MFFKKINIVRVLPVFSRAFSWHGFGGDFYFWFFKACFKGFSRDFMGLVKFPGFYRVSFGFLRALQKSMFDV